MPTDIGLIADYVGKIGILMGVVGVVLWLWLRPKIHSEFATVTALENEVARSKAREASIEDRLQDDLKGMEGRISNIEANMRTLPTKEDHHRLAVQLAEQGGDIKALTAIMSRVSSGVDRIEGTMLKGK